MLTVDFDSFINVVVTRGLPGVGVIENGCRSRSLLTSVGVLDLQVPCDREGEYRPDLFARYKRVDRSLEEAIRAIFLSGASTRKVGDILDVLCGEPALASRPAICRRSPESLMRR